MPCNNFEIALKPSPVVDLKWKRDEYKIDNIQKEI